MAGTHTHKQTHTHTHTHTHMNAHMCTHTHTHNTSHTHKRGMKCSWFCHKDFATFFNAHSCSINILQHRIFINTKCHWNHDDYRTSIAMYEYISRQKYAIRHKALLPFFGVPFPRAILLASIISLKSCTAIKKEDTLQNHHHIIRTVVSQ